MTKEEFINVCGKEFAADYTVANAVYTNLTMKDLKAFATAWKNPSVRSSLLEAVVCAYAVYKDQIREALPNLLSAFTFHMNKQFMDTLSQIITKQDLISAKLECHFSLDEDELTYLKELLKNTKNEPTTISD